MRNFLVRTLGPRCKHVEEAADTDEASRMLDKSRFDVVILDNIMPGKNGVDWLAEQRAVGFFADAILITAFADLDTAIQALRAGAVDFVLKPFRSNQIRTRSRAVSTESGCSARTMSCAMRCALHPIARSCATI